jgi:hypothetical protein
MKRIFANIREYVCWSPYLFIFIFVEYEYWIPYSFSFSTNIRQKSHVHIRQKSHVHIRRIFANMNMNMNMSNIRPSLIPVSTSFCIGHRAQLSHLCHYRPISPEPTPDYCGSRHGCRTISHPDQYAANLLEISRDYSRRSRSPKDPGRTRQGHPHSGYSPTAFELGNLMASADFLVVDTLAVPVILGCDFINQFVTSIKPKEGYIQLDGGQ